METAIGLVTTLLSLLYSHDPTGTRVDLYTSEHSVGVTVKHAEHCFVVKATDNGNTYCCCINTDGTDYLTQHIPKP
jgi:hypothetical protein